MKTLTKAEKSVIISTVVNDLERLSDPALQLSAKRFFKEKITLHGIRSADVKIIDKKYLKELKGYSKEAIFDLCELLFKTGYFEECIIAGNWCYSARKQFTPDDADLFGTWINKYIHTWATCDNFCNHSVGSLLEMYPESLIELASWSRSPNLWMRRAAAVSLIVPAKKGLYLKEVFALAQILLKDQEDLVQKGYGWMLKVAANKHEKEVFEFIMAYKKDMPRTALRYAIEKMPEHLRSKAMEK